MSGLTELNQHRSFRQTDGREAFAVLDEVGFFGSLIFYNKSRICQKKKGTKI
jgi:hypothetical protein